VFTCWGFGPGTPGVEPASLSRLAVPRAAFEAAPEEKAAPAPAAPPVAPPAPPRRGGCLWWLLPLALACALVFLLFTSFAGLPAPSGTAFLHFDGPDFLRAPASPQKEIEARSAEIESLRQRVSEHAALCRKTEPAAPKAENQLVIPENASDPAFLAGRWRCDTGLANKRTGEAVVFEFAFDQNGKGQGIIHEKRDRCTGDATAHFRDGVLHIDLGPQRCQNSSGSYAAVSIDCRAVPGGQSQCVGTNDDGTRWDADFRRVR
ncbi:MAG: hypothetical protein HDQ94_00505, partial [Desulfovibrio sp.]|nr:hypothetical protein [Desulfovibrio sp.]